MMIQEPKVEFVELKAEDVVATSGTSLDVCQGTTDNSCPNPEDWL